MLIVTCKHASLFFEKKLGELIGLVTLIISESSKTMTLLTWCVRLVARGDLNRS